MRIQQEPQRVPSPHVIVFESQVQGSKLSSTMFWLCDSEKRTDLSGPLNHNKQQPRVAHLTYCLAHRKPGTPGQTSALSEPGLVSTEA